MRLVKSIMSDRGQLLVRLLRNNKHDSLRVIVKLMAPFSTSVHKKEPIEEAGTPTSNAPVKRVVCRLIESSVSIAKRRYDG